MEQDHDWERGFPFLVTLAVDAMGGDHAPREIVRGAAAALQGRQDLELLLVGRREQVEQALEGIDYPAERLKLIHADEVIQGDDHPALAIRRKKRSSLVTALRLVREGEADAILSAGNTGALMAGALLVLGRLPGVTRPALLAVIPGFGEKPFVLVDAGANMDARSGHLLQYAFMGRIYARKLLNRPAPRVALLNVVAETNKGNRQLKKAFPLLQEYLDGFCGNVEGTDLFSGAADVVVCDGFVGNILLKTVEGLGRAVFGRFARELAGELSSPAGSSPVEPALARLRNQVEGAGYGGAPLVGVKGLCIKCHGSSQARSIEQAVLHQAYPFVRLKLEDLFLEDLREMSGCLEEKELPELS